ncbi:hypothetical protein PENTCL1PPCAC_23501 [Pristionchus entomophagus]|uniref:Uncharacterized protein n=1 Tax=Pristionchus entomophagus TaxID=358040 RepID=A0AAV5U3I6_9BILA|nr:hypothetical protein PENTCL1PPCAC_23501 [Pristionchus entomophagus]
MRLLQAATPVPAAAAAPAAKPAAANPKLPSSPILKTSVSASVKPPTVLKKEPSPAPKNSVAKKEASPAPKATVTKEASPTPKQGATVMRKEASPAPKTTVTPEAKKSTVVKEASPAPAKTVVKKDSSPAPPATKTTVIPATVSKPSAAKEPSPAPKSTATVVKKEPSPAPKSTVVKKEASPAPKAIVSKDPSPTPKPAATVEKKEASPAPKIKDQSATKREASPAPKRRERSRSREPSVGVAIVLGGAEGESKGGAVERVKDRSVVREGSPSLLAMPQRSARKSPEKETKTMDSPPDSATLPKRRDRTARTLDALKTKLEEQKKDGGERGEEADRVEELSRATSRPPMLLVTQPSLPSTPRASTSGGYVWEDARSDGTDEDEEEEEDSDTEFCVSETFRIEQPRVHLGILEGGRRASKSPFGSDFDSDIDMSVFLAAPGSGRRDSRGRVGAGAALPAPPPPIFTASITFDGQEECWDSAREEDDDEYRPGSSAMGVYLSPAEFSSDESFDGEHYHDSVQVGCTLTLCQKAALRGDDETDSEFYESEEYSDESWYEDEDEEMDEDEDEYGSEYDEDEEEDEDVSRWSEPPRDSSLAPRFEHLEADVSVDLVEYEEVDGEMGLSATLSLSKATSKRILKDGQSERTDVSVVAQSVVPFEESVRGEEVAELKEPTVETSSARMVQSSPIARKKDIHVVPTYVKPQEEKVKAEEAGRFAADKKTATDFAKKSVIQPPKLAKADVKQVETKIGEEKLKPVDEPKKETAKPPAAAAAAAKPATPAAAKPAADAAKKAEPEDKSAARKSALNMSAEEAKRKEKEEKEAAQSKARRFGTVSSLADKFKEEPKEKEEYSYKRSSRLTQRDEERPRKKYEIVKPVLNDDFDKQVAELRSKMKTGTTQLQSQMMELNKGILSQTEEVKLKELEDKHKSLLNKTSGVFGKADEEKERWKKARDAETEKDLIKIEEGKRRGKTPQPEEKKKDELKPAPAEPKRTVRKINRDKSPTPVPPANAAAAPAAAGEKTTPAAAAIVTKTGAAPAATAAGKIPDPPKPPPAPGVMKKEKEEEKKATPKPLRKTMNTQPMTLKSGPMKMPDATIEVNDNNADLFEAVAIVATKRKKSIIEMRNAKEEAKKERLQALREGKTIKEIQGPKGDGAAATKIRNAQAKADDISQASSDRSANKRYAARRKTQELVNPSTLTAEPKPKRRRRGPSKRRRYTRDPHDIDVLLGWDKENTFEQLEKKFNASAMDKMKPPTNAERSAMRKRRRPMNTKIWISELTDIDKIYKTSELRDIQASVG